MGPGNMRSPTRHLDDCDRLRVCQVDNPIPMTTANGDISADVAVDVQVEGLPNNEFHVYIARDSPLR
jgi:hypothetical protein